MNAHRVGRSILLATLVALFSVSHARACPFCNAVTPTFAERRESATVCALVEAESPSGGQWRTHVHRLHKGDGLFAQGNSLLLKAGAAVAQGDLLLALGAAEKEGDPPSEWRWEVMPVSPLSYLYFAKAPDMRTSAAERLAYFVPYLENEEADIAADAFAEFGRAPLEAVESVAERELMQRARDWLRDTAVPNERKGGYALLLGVASDADEREENKKLLREIIDAEREDFRAGFDGILAGDLLLEPDAALQLIDERYIANQEARPGDTRHAIAALRFCVEYARGPARQEVVRVLENVLTRKAYAAEIIPDLARAKDWTQVATVAGLYNASEQRDRQLNRAVIGYLKSCPAPNAQAELTRLRAKDPAGVKEVERALAVPMKREGAKG